MTFLIPLPGHFGRHLYWEQAFPQYGLGYDAVLKSLESMENDLPGLVYSGNYTDILGTKSSLLGLAVSMYNKSKGDYQLKIQTTLNFIFCERDACKPVKIIAPLALG